MVEKLVKELNQNMNKERIFLTIFLILIFSSSSFVYGESKTYTEVQTEVGGDNASVHTEIDSVVNGKEVKIESDSLGEIKVEVENGEVKVESDTEASPTVIISDLDEKEKKEAEEEKKIGKFKEVQEKIAVFLENFITRLRQFFSGRI